MPQTTTCKISFDDNDDCVYYGGQLVHGHVQLVLGKEKTVRGNYKLSTQNVVIFILFKWPFPLLNCSFDNQVKNKLISCSLFDFVCCKIPLNMPTIWNLMKKKWWSREKGKKRMVQLKSIHSLAICGYWTTIALILIDFLFGNFIGFLLLLSSSLCHNSPNNWVCFFLIHFTIVWWYGIFVAMGRKTLYHNWPVCLWKWKGIYVDFLGRSYCYWTEGTGSKKESHTATEIYLEERQYLFGSATGKHSKVIVSAF